jgi:hypothetical protein
MRSGRLKIGRLDPGFLIGPEFFLGERGPVVAANALGEE